jgi:hypothetical protein
MAFYTLLTKEDVKVEEAVESMEDAGFGWRFPSTQRW